VGEVGLGSGALRLSIISFILIKNNKNNDNNNNNNNNKAEA
jgi:hypothetical protein